jgi:glycosyltransferase involved in cell wall biosynthesis
LTRRLVAIGFARPATGLERVMVRILGALATEFEVHWLGLGYQGPVAGSDACTLHPTNVAGGDVFAVDAGRDLADALGAEVVLLYNDWWLLEKYRRAFDGGRRSRVVAYCPIDGRITTPQVAELAEAVGWVDDLVTFTDVARVELERVVGRPVPVIGHGVDDLGFAPMDRAAARASALPGVGPDAFVVLNANRLQPRKRIDVTVDAFAALAADRPDVHLVLHHALAGLGDDRERLDRQLAGLDGEVAARIHLHRTELSSADLNVLYNACDVGVNTSAGEGWGLVSFEHALTGAAQVVPGHSACAELWAGAAEVVEPADAAAVPPYAKLAMQEVAPAAVAAALARLHDDPDHRRTMAAAGQARAQEHRFTWAEVGRRWRALLGPPG